MQPVRSLNDIVNQRGSLRINCQCGREINLPAIEIIERFKQSCSLDEAKRRLKCKRCGKRAVVKLDPIIPTR